MVSHEIFVLGGMKQDVLSTLYRSLRAIDRNGRLGELIYRYFADPSQNYRQLITENYIFKNDKWVGPSPRESIRSPQLVLFFSSVKALIDEDCYTKLKNKFPNALVVGCSTAGEILNEEVCDDSAVAVAIEFEKTHVEIVSKEILDSSQSRNVGESLAEQMPHENLKAVFVISDGQIVNGTQLLEGMKEAFSNSVVVTGGLAGDGPNFRETYVASNTRPKKGMVAVVGFYGDHFRISHGHAGGWNSFGPYRKVTKSDANVLYELDGQPALELYKKYLGDESEYLPSSALLFPLMIKPGSTLKEGMVRTILSIDETDNSMTFAGDIPQGYVARLMISNFDKLIDGASRAANRAVASSMAQDETKKLAILVSCVGRKLLLGEQAEDEVVAVKSVFDKNTSQIGFYSYGEISPHLSTAQCELHNQTMTVTLISESNA